MENSLQHHGILGMKWGVRKEQKRAARMERKDVKWIKKRESKIEKNIRKPAERSLEKAIGSNPRRLSSGQISKTYINEYNQRLASLMNSRVGNLKSPSGRLVQFVAKRGEIGVFTALADQGYNMDQLKRGLHASGRIAYRKQTVEKV